MSNAFGKIWHPAVGWTTGTVYADFGGGSGTVAALVTAITGKTGTLLSGTDFYLLGDVAIEPADGETIPSGKIENLPKITFRCGGWGSTTDDNTDRAAILALHGTMITLYAWDPTSVNYAYEFKDAIVNCYSTVTSLGKEVIVMEVEVTNHSNFNYIPLALA